MVNIPIRCDWYDSIFSNYEKMVKSTTFSVSFLCYSFPPDTKTLRTRIYFRVLKNDIENQYDLYSISCADGSSVLEGIYFAVSYAPVAGIISLSIIIAIVSTEFPIIFVLDISNDFQNNILPNLSERFYLS